MGNGPYFSGLQRAPDNWISSDRDFGACHYDRTPQPAVSPQERLEVFLKKARVLSALRELIPRGPGFLVGFPPLAERNLSCAETPPVLKVLLKVSSAQITLCSRWKTK